MSSSKILSRLKIVTLGIGAGVVLWAAQPAAAVAKDDLPYPWCALKGDPECTFMTFQQCEESVDWHGVCESYPNLPPPNAGTVRRAR
jgi:hypothetical protein